MNLVLFSIAGAASMVTTDLTPEVHIGIAGTIMAVIKFLLDTLKRDGIREVVAKFLPTEYIPLISLGLGIVTALLTKYQADQSWMIAIIYGAIPAGAVFLDQLMRTKDRIRSRSESISKAKAMTNTELTEAINHHIKRQDPTVKTVGHLTDDQLEAAFRESASRDT